MLTIRDVPVEDNRRRNCEQREGRRAPSGAEADQQQCPARDLDQDGADNECTGEWHAVCRHVCRDAGSMHYVAVTHDQENRC